MAPYLCRVFEPAAAAAAVVCSANSFEACEPSAQQLASGRAAFVTFVSLPLMRVRFPQACDSLRRARASSAAAAAAAADAAAGAARPRQKNKFQKEKKKEIAEKGRDGIRRVRWRWHPRSSVRDTASSGEQPGPAGSRLTTSSAGQGRAGQGLVRYVICLPRARDRRCK